MNEYLKKLLNTKNRKEKEEETLVREVHIRKTIFLAIRKRE